MEVKSFSELLTGRLPSILDPFTRLLPGLHHLARYSPIIFRCSLVGALGLEVQNEEIRVAAGVSSMAL